MKKIYVCLLFVRVNKSGTECTVPISSDSSVYVKRCYLKNLFYKVYLFCTYGPQGTFCKS